MRRRAMGQAVPLSAAKKTIFAVTSVAGFFLLAELCLALIGVQPVLYFEDPYAGFSSTIPLFVETRDAGGEAIMVTAENKRRWFNQQRFPKQKPENTYRIFSVGGSTTFGRPFNDTVSFSGWLREMIASADPSRHWEVINAGGVSYASYRVAVVMEELIRYQPDLFIIYTGHNEFLERRSYAGLAAMPAAIPKLGGWLSRTRTHAALGRVISSFSAAQAARPPGRPLLSSEVDTILSHAAGPRDYSRDDALRENIAAHFRFNLHRMIAIARSVGARVVLITPASNLKDSAPFKSEHRAGMDLDELLRFESLERRAEQERKRGDLAASLAACDEAISLDPRYAATHYQRAAVLYAMQRDADAGSAFERAKEEDVCPLRATAALSGIVREVATAEEVPLADFKRLTVTHAGRGIPGSDEFLDHVHPTIEMSRLLALELFHLLERQNVVTRSKDWNNAALARVIRRVEGRIDGQAQGEALRNLARLFSWAGKLEESARLARHALRRLGDDPESYDVLGQAAAARGATAQAIEHYRKALELNPRYADAHANLGIELLRLDQFGEALGHLQEAVALDPALAHAQMHLGLALAARGESRAAIGRYRKATGISPSYAEAWNNLGAELATVGEASEAARHFREALKIKPNYADAHLNLGLLRASEGRCGEAQAHYREALRIDPENEKGYYNLGVAAFSENSYDEAAAYFREALRMDPNFAEAHLNLGILLARRGNSAEAAIGFRRALEINPEYARAREQLAALEPD